MKTLHALITSLTVTCCLNGAVAAQDEDVFLLRPSADKPSTLGHIGPTGILAHIEVGLKVTVTGTREGSPGEGKFEKGEVITAVNGKSLEGANPFVVLGSAITAAEAANGMMEFEVASKGGSRKVSVQIPVMGAYSKTWPVDCPKSAKIIGNAAESYAKKLEEDPGLGIHGALISLFLLSTGDDAHLPLIRKHYQKYIDSPGSIGTHTWNNGYNGIACAEYYLRTGDKDMLPVLQFFCDDARDRQNFNAAWMHWGSGINPNYVAGGLMNPASVQVLTSLLLSKEAGLDVDEKTLTDCLRYFYRFAGHGSVPYGDHRAEGGVASNGKDAMLAAAMQVASGAAGDTTAYRSARDSLSMATLDGYPGMLTGHGDYGRGDGIWRGIASSYLMEKKPERFREIRDKITWWYDLSRFDDGALGLATCQSHNDPGSGAAAAIAYTAPLKTLRITGAPPSKHSKEFTLPERIWGNEADLAFLGIEPADGFDRYGKPPSIREIIDLLGSSYTKPKSDPASVPLNQLKQFVRHNSYLIRTQAAKALRMKGELKVLEELLHDPDPRLRRAALDGIIDWSFWSGPGKDPLASEEFTPQMMGTITAMLGNPKEAAYVAEAALFAIGYMPVDVIGENFAVILPATEHGDWWFREASFMALQATEKKPELYAKMVPLLIDMMVSENHTMPRTRMNKALADTMKKYGADTEVGKMLVKAFSQSVEETQVLDGSRSREGIYNISHSIELALRTAPETAPQLASLLVERGLASLDDDEFISMVSGGKGFAGFIAHAAGMSGSSREDLEAVLYDSFRPEIARRLKAGGGKDIGMIDALLGVTGLRDSKSGWQDIGSPGREERVWKYTSFHPTKEKDKLPKRDGRRFRKVDLPENLEGWFKPEYDASKWQSGKAPIGKGSHPREGKDTPKSRSVWGEGEILLARTSFEVKDTGFDLHRLRIMATQGYEVYLNGKRIERYTWFKDPDTMQIWPMDESQAALLDKGTNTLAVYTFEVYPSAMKPNWKGEVFGKLDCYIEGLRMGDLY